MSALRCVCHLQTFSGLRVEEEEVGARQVGEEKRRRGEASLAGEGKRRGERRGRRLMDGGMELL